MWWGWVEDKKIGPLEKNELAKLILEENVNGETLVWKAGMEDWLPLSTIEEFGGKLREVPLPPPKSKAPPVPEGDAGPSLTIQNTVKNNDDSLDASKTEHQGTSKITSLENFNSPINTDTGSKPKGRNQVKAGPFRRFFARTFDLWLEMLIIASMVIATFPKTVIPLLDSPPYRVGLIVALVFLSLMLDTFIYKVFGNTPGKALLGVQVRNISGKSLNVYGYLNRNLGLWVRGLWLGIPLVSLIPVFMAFVNVMKGNQTKYDFDNECSVYYKPIGILGHFPFFVFALILTYALAFSGFMLQAFAPIILQTASSSQAEISPRAITNNYSAAQDENIEPEFKDYLARRYYGTFAEPDFSGEYHEYWESHPRWREFVRKEVLKGPNFNEYERIFALDCGAACANYLVIDLRNGKISDIPIAADVPERGFGRPDEIYLWDLEFKPYSRLIKSSWCYTTSAQSINTQIMVYQYLLYDNGEFKSLGPVRTEYKKCSTL